MPSAISTLHIPLQSNKYFISEGYMHEFRKNDIVKALQFKVINNAFQTITFKSCWDTSSFSLRNSIQLYSPSHTIRINASNLIKKAHNIE